MQYATRRGAFGMAIDHVLLDAGTGTCTVHGYDEGFGDDPGTVAFDEEFDWTQVPDGVWYSGRIDHFALECDLEIDFTAL